MATEEIVGLAGVAKEEQEEDDVAKQAQCRAEGLQSRVRAHFRELATQTYRQGGRACHLVL